MIGPIMGLLCQSLDPFKAVSTDGVSSAGLLAVGSWEPPSVESGDGFGRRGGLALVARPSSSLHSAGTARPCPWVLEGSSTLLPAFEVRIISVTVPVPVVDSTCAVTAAANGQDCRKYQPEWVNAVGHLD